MIASGHAAQKLARTLADVDETEEAELRHGEGYPAPPAGAGAIVGKEELTTKAPKRKRSVGTTSTADASVSKSDEHPACVVCAEDEPDSQTSTPGSTLTDTDRMPARKRNVCAQSGCSTFARCQSAGSTCYAHGSGGKRCKVPDCLKSAVGGTGACVAHGLFLVVTPPGESLSRRESFR